MAQIIALNGQVWEMELLARELPTTEAAEVRGFASMGRAIISTAIDELLAARL